MKICVGGKLYIELSRTRIRELLVEFDRAGILIRVESDEIDDAEKSILSIGINSDDPHILALAKVSRTRLLYTEDRELMDDFRNTQVLTPKGVVITPSTPAHHTDNKLREHSP